jgi:hypothetical protein
MPQVEKAVECRAQLSLLLVLDMLNADEMVVHISHPSKPGHHPNGDSGLHLCTQSVIFAANGDVPAVAEVAGHFPVNKGHLVMRSQQWQLVSVVCAKGAWR